jgi:predicted dehydrogenase
LTARGARAIGVGVIGLGYMGRVHVEAYAAARAAGFANRLAAVCDADAERRSGRAAAAGNIAAVAGIAALFDPAATRAYAKPEELLADREVELVSICTPTDTHVDLAIAALAAGKHVLVEKPLALRARDVERLAAAAREAATLCMPAMCMRFWPGWSWLKERIDERALGRVRSAVFRRLASRPAWSPFYADAARSGGALFDLHVHDADFVRWCFGPPATVASTGTTDHVTTLYRYPDGPAHVVAEGGWDHATGFAFRMGYTVVFDQATADYDFTREPRLVVARGGRAEPVALEDATGWQLEVRHLLDAIRSGRRELPATVDEAVGLTRMLAAEGRSLDTHATVDL